MKYTVKTSKLSFVNQYSKHSYCNARTQMGHCTLHVPA